jgi:DNA-binding transcriptional LysR family regulator
MGGLYCRRGHPLARKSQVHADDIRRYGVALISISPALMEGLAVGYGFTSAKDFPVAVECDDIHTLVHLSVHTDVLGLLPQAIAAASAKSLRCLSVSKALVPFADVYAIWLKGRTLSPSAKRAIALARQVSRGPELQRKNSP